MGSVLSFLDWDLLSMISDTTSGKLSLSKVLGGNIYTVQEKNAYTCQ